MAGRKRDGEAKDGSGGRRRHAAAAKTAVAAQRKPVAKRRPRGRPRREPAAAEARRAAILAAALEVFAEHGFAAARLEDVASRAGVAKGTLYLYFSDKEALFEGLVRSAIAPLIDRISAMSEAGGSAGPEAIGTLLALFSREVLGTDRRHIVNLILSEGRRFPRLVELYHREVVSRGLEAIRRLAGAGAGRGGGSPAARYPQLVVAPLLLAVVWETLFARIAPLDVEGMLAAHAELLTGAIGRSA